MKLFDLHADLGYAVAKKRKEGHSRVLSSFYTDALRKGGIKAVFMACWFDGSQDFEQMCAMIQALKADIAQCEEVKLVCDGRMIDWTDDKIYAMLSVEGMCGIDRDPETRLDWLYAQGVRMGSLCWNEENALASGTRSQKGLTPLGIRAVRHMERIGMRIDVSHASERTFWDIAAHTEGILVASHSNAAALCSHPRNLSDEQIRLIGRRKGIIGATAVGAFVDGKKGYQDIGHLARHVERLCRCAGDAHVGFGFDFERYYDGSGDGLRGLEGPEQCGALIDWLKRDPRYEKTACENAVRIFSFE